MPRKQPDINRLTLRMVQPLYDKFNDVCERFNITQREFVEQAIRDELDEPLDETAVKENGAIARTGMWIDPALVREMDARIAKEGGTQRALIERAVRRRLEKFNV